MVAKWTSLCVRDIIFADFLERNRAEVKKVSLYEYDAEKHMQQVREEAKEDGRMELLQEQIAKKLEKGLSVQEIAEALEEEPDTIRNLITHKKEG